MNSKIRWKGLSLFALMVLASCIQGPWDYYPRNPKIFKGISVSGYAMSGRALDRVCFEPLYDLAQEATEAFAFFDSATVQVTGSFQGKNQTITLTPIDTMPNCFRSGPADTIVRGQIYALDAKIIWDSAGQTVTSRLTSTAHVPESFSIHTDALAPKISETGGIPSNIFASDFLFRLPPKVQPIFQMEYGDSLIKLKDDTTALANYLKINGKKIQDRLIELLSEEKITYKKGDTLFYLNGALNTLSHYYSSDRSPDVNVVLVTQRFDPKQERPETRFDSFLGLNPDSSTYYFPGDIRRIIAYPDAKSNKGWNLLDSIGIVNTWFFTGRNRLYFYGLEKSYAEYLATTVGLGNGPDSRVKPKFNVNGGAGFFVGGIPDSFDVNIKYDPFTKHYPLPEVHGNYCRDKGWNDNADCRNYYKTYCSEKNWRVDECYQAAQEVCWESKLPRNDSLKTDSLKGVCDNLKRNIFKRDSTYQAGFINKPEKKDSILADSLASVKSDSTSTVTAIKVFCAEENYPDLKTNSLYPSSNSTSISLESLCKEPKNQSFESKGENQNKEALWNYCLDHGWKPTQCQLGLVSYCKDKPRLSETLCKNADKYCAIHPEETLCK